jgi:hypothetical protein
VLLPGIEPLFSTSSIFIFKLNFYQTKVSRKQNVCVITFESTRASHIKNIKLNCII